VKRKIITVSTMRFSSPITATLVASLFSQTTANGISSKLQVHLPHTLSKPGGYEHREALFGIPPYGASLQQSVYYADSELCDDTVDTHGGYPIRSKDSSGKMIPWPAPYILMVDRGGCTFVQKVRNAQRAGAAGVIIADDTCLCTAGDLCTPDPGEECESNEPIMADDGSGADITIPSFLMFKEDADPVKAELKANHNVRIEMAWALPNPDARVEYELWTIPTDKISEPFQKEFKEAAIALGKHAQFTPHMYIYDGIKSGCQSDDGENECYNLCTNSGRYCATDPDNDLDHGISGADVVKESLRRICIWKIHGDADGIGVEWWDYINEFMFRCDNEKFFANEDCAKDAMQHASVDYNKVQMCMKDSGGLEGDVKNTVLEEQLSAKETSGVVILPATYVNNTPLRGELEFATVFKAICAGFSKGSEPQVCIQCANCKEELNCVLKKKCSSDATHSVSVPIFAAALLSMFLCFCCVGLIQWQRSQRHMREQVKGILAEYMPLDDMNKIDSATDADDGEFA